MQNRPTYTVGAVDHALRLAQLLQTEGPIRVTDAAERLGVAVSTAHRLLNTLIYRDFAVQNQDRTYGPGPLLRPLPRVDPATGELRKIAQPLMRRLVELEQESVNLVVLVGTDALFVASVECDQVLRVGDRAGRLLPPHVSSGGKAILACLPHEAVAQIVSSHDGVDLTRLRRELALARRRGYAVNDQKSERGLSAIGVPIRDASGAPIAALCFALPTVRFTKDRAEALAARLRSAAAWVAINLREREQQGTVEDVENAVDLGGPMS